MHNIIFNIYIGCLIVANEGINGTIAAAPENMDNFLAFLRSDTRFADLEVKVSFR